MASAQESTQGFETIAEFEAFVQCPLFSEQAKVSVCRDELVVSALFDQLVVPYADMVFLAFQDYQVNVRSSLGSLALSRLGRQAEWLYDQMLQAYNDAVLRAFSVEGQPLFEAKGDFEAVEGEREFGGPCHVRLYEDCLCLLPPNQNARRIPWCFLTGFGKDAHSCTFSLATGERYTVSRLGRELANLERMAVARMRALRESTAAWHRELDEKLPAVQLPFTSKLMPLGAAAVANDIAAAAPSLLEAMEAKVGESRIASTYPWLKGLCGSGEFMLGMVPAPAKEEGADALAAAMPAAVGAADASGAAAGAVAVEGMASAEGADAAATEEGAENPPIVWVIAPDETGRVAAVELALADGEASATYLYRVQGSWRTFGRQLDRALEAAAFKREPFLLSDEELRQPAHAADAMLVTRTPAIAFARSCFAGRAIHSSRDRWQADVRKVLSAL